jgi:hypothetical protein
MKKKQYQNLAIKNTDKWLKETIIALNFCPFAKSPYEKGLVRIIDSKSSNDLTMLDAFIDQVAHLELNLRADLSTTILSFSNCHYGFDDFNDWSYECDQFLRLADLDTTFQAVVFHPNFYFADENPTSITNMVNQSPYPTIHIIRNVEIEEAVLKYATIRDIPEKNRLKILELFPNQK